MTTKPRKPAERSAPPALGLRGTLVFLWRQLTSMQTALVLLMLLAVAAVPGSLYPQRSVNAQMTEEFLRENGRWGEFLDAIGMFDVFTSPWFSAVYLLLFISLIGCIVPRVGEHLKALRTPPPRTPSKLTRFAGHTLVHLPGVDPETALDAARQELRGARFRTVVLEEKASLSVSAERGHLRESGNILFHLGLVAVLICLMGGHLVQYRGQVTIVEGEGVSNSLASYDSFRPGPWFDPTSLPPFRLTLEDFRAEYESTPGSTHLGEPRSFQADLLMDTPGQEPYQQTVEVNRPLNMPGASVFLLGNGYAPEITVTDPEGNVVAEGPIITIPNGDRGYTSQLVLKAPDAKPEQLAVVGFFLPTGRIDHHGPHSVFPDALQPELAVTVYKGDLGLDAGVPKNVYEVDLTTMKAVTGEDGSPALVRLPLGQKATLPDGTTIAFNDLRRYAAFDVAHNPFELGTLIASLLSTGGLILSLFVPRRRVWARVRSVSDGSTLEVAGLARSEDAALADEVRALAERLTQSLAAGSPSEPQKAP